MRNSHSLQRSLELFFFQDIKYLSKTILHIPFNCHRKAESNSTIIRLCEEVDVRQELKQWCQHLL